MKKLDPVSKVFPANHRSKIYGPVEVSDCLSDRQREVFLGRGQGKGYFLMPPAQAIAVGKELVAAGKRAKKVDWEKRKR